MSIKPKQESWVKSISAGDFTAVTASEAVVSMNAYRKRLRQLLDGGKANSYQRELIDSALSILDKAEERIIKTSAKGIADAAQEARGILPIPYATGTFRKTLKQGKVDIEFSKDSFLTDCPEWGQLVKELARSESWKAALIKRIDTLEKGKDIGSYKSTLQLDALSLKEDKALWALVPLPWRQRFAHLKVSYRKVAKSPKKKITKVA